MKIIRFSKISAKIGNALHVLTYELLKDTVPYRESYGILVLDETTGEVEAVMDLTGRSNVADAFYMLALNGRVTPGNLKEIAEDYMAEQ